MAPCSPQMPTRTPGTPWNCSSKCPKLKTCFRVACTVHRTSADACMETHVQVPDISVAGSCTDYFDLRHLVFLPHGSHMNSIMCHGKGHNCSAPWMVAIQHAIIQTTCSSPALNLGSSLSQSDVCTLYMSYACVHPCSKAHVLLSEHKHDFDYKHTRL